MIRKFFKSGWFILLLMFIVMGIMGHMEVQDIERGLL